MEARIAAGGRRADAEFPLPKNAARGLTRADWQIIGVILIIKLCLFVFALTAYEIIEDQHINSVRGTLEIWKHWDVTRYLCLPFCS